MINHRHSKLLRNLKILNYRFTDIKEGILRRPETGKRPAWGYQKLADHFKINKSAVIRICQRRLYWVDKLKELSKEYLNENSK